MADYSLRPGTPADAAALAALGQATFAHTFGHTYRPADLAAFLAGAYSVAWHEALLADRTRATWVADSGGELIGFGIAGACKLPVPSLEPRAGEIQRLYLRGDWQGRGIGSRLLEQLLAELQRRGHAPLYVGVWSQNLGAQRLYARYGFNKVGDYFFPVGEHRDHEFILKRSVQDVSGETAC
jgi:ribosomal protein S18 acetylase RimI-like enzyme